MSDETLIQYCSPTLAGLKSGNLFSADFSSHEEMVRELRHYNRMLSAKGILLLPLHYQGGKGKIYVFRPARLQSELNNDHARRILRQRGYECGNLNACLRRLKQRLSGEEEFPHEIGLFLSYPPEDVEGFIREKASNYKSVGTWKVYGDQEKSERIFIQYHRCREIYQKNYENGISLKKLAVTEG